MKKTYLLYDNINQNKLHALAENIDDVMEFSKYYTNGVWFEYNIKISKNKTEFLTGEKEFGYDQFPKVAEKRPKFKIEADERIPVT